MGLNGSVRVSNWYEFLLLLRFYSRFKLYGFRGSFKYCILDKFCDDVMNTFSVVYSSVEFGNAFIRMQLNRTRIFRITIAGYRDHYICF